MKTVTVVDSVYDTLPEEALNDLREAWADYEIGNDWYYLRADYIIDANAEIGEYPSLAKWLTETFDDPEAVLLHFWW